jgi:hypothetical protein
LGLNLLLPKKNEVLFTLPWVCLSHGSASIACQSSERPVRSHPSNPPSIRLSALPTTSRLMVPPPPARPCTLILLRPPPASPPPIPVPSHASRCCRSAFPSRCPCLPLSRARCDSLTQNRSQPVPPSPHKFLPLRPGADASWHPFLHRRHESPSKRRQRLRLVHLAAFSFFCFSSSQLAASDAGNSRSPTPPATLVAQTSPDSCGERG